MNPVKTRSKTASFAAGMLLALGLIGCASRGGGSASAKNNTWFDATNTRVGGTTTLDAASASGDDVNARDKFARTPLHYAAFYHNAPAVKVLLSKGAEVDPIDKDGKTPLNMAADEANTPAALALIDAGADPNIVDRRGRTPLWLAAYRGQTQTAKAMLAHGGDPSITDPKGRTAGETAADRGFPELAAILDGHSGSTPPAAFAATPLPAMSTSQP